ncbi:molybdopterin-dependent oxidoreductase [Syntrophomonas erecta]
MPGQKISLKSLLALIVVLIVLIGLFGYLNARGEKLAEGTIILKAGKQVIGEITIEDVEKLPAVNKKVVINSTSGLSKHKFTGTPLAEVFNHFDPQIVKQYERVITRGVDNYVSGVNMEEVLEKNNVLLVYADNGEPLKSKTGTSGTMRIIILNDLYGQRFTNYLVEIELE